MNCQWCGEDNKDCLCQWTCSDCGLSLTNQEFKNNENSDKTPNYQPLCDPCVWALRH